VSEYRAALQKRDLRLLFGGMVISATGTWAYNVALLAYVFDKTHSLGWVGAAGLARFIPSLLLSAYAGVIAERFERVRVMVASDLLCVAFQARGIDLAIGHACSPHGKDGAQRVAAGEATDCLNEMIARPLWVGDVPGARLLVRDLVRQRRVAGRTERRGPYSLIEDQACQEQKGNYRAAKTMAADG